MTQPTIEPNMTLEQAARKAAEIFRWYEQLHAAKPDMEKAKRNAEFAEMLERALTAQAGDGWQPIETAPKDLRVIVWTGQNIYVAKWVKNILNDHEAFMICETGVPGERVIVQPTHWMPCPQQPAHAAAKGE